jgi:hypothetical protein
MALTEGKREEIAGRVLQETYVVEGGEIYSAQILYPLSEADFIHLRNQHGWSSRLASVFIGSVITSGILVVAKVTDAMVNAVPPAKNLVEALRAVNGWELWALLISLLLLLVTFFIGRCIPTKGSKVLRKIEQHFEKR